MHQVAAGFNQQNQCYEIRTQTACNADDEVLINYGSHDNAKLLVEYGFLLNDNPNNTLPCCTGKYLISSTGKCFHLPLPFTLIVIFRSFQNEQMRATAHVAFCNRWSEKSMWKPKTGLHEWEDEHNTGEWAAYASILSSYLVNLRKKESTNLVYWWCHNDVTYTCTHTHTHF